MKMQKSISVKFEKVRIIKAEDIYDLSKHLGGNVSSWRSQDSTLAVILTYNDYTKYWTHDVIEECRKFKIDEIVIFKDPTKSPYLCDFPSQQKGFKRPPS